jgi:fucose 4-O-acetylase-like acetyltransferase
VGQKGKKERNGFLDALKGFAILLVVAGHAIQSLPNFDDNVIFRIIYSFHMPLFMFLSGAVAAYSLKPMNWGFIKTKALILVLPFIAWYLAGYIVSGAYHTMDAWAYVSRWIFAPDYGLWFLWVLFLNFCLLAVAKNLQPKLGTASFVVVWLIAKNLPFGQFGLSLVEWHFTFFLLGYLIFFYREQLRPYRTPALAACAVAFPVLVVAWKRTTVPDFAPHLQAILARHDLGGLYNDLMEVYKYAVPLAGIGAAFLVFKLAANRHLYAVMGWLGVYTMEVYVSHQYFFQYALGKGIVHMLTGAVLALAGSLLVAFVVLKRVAILNRLFLGGRGPARQAPAAAPAAVAGPTLAQPTAVSE